DGGRLPAADRGGAPTSAERWSGKRDSNPRPSAWKADALPLSYSRPRNAAARLVEGEGFEPSKACAGRFTVCSLWPLGHPSRLHAEIDLGQTAGRMTSWRRDSNPQPPHYK